MATYKKLQKSSEIFVKGYSTLSGAGTVDISVNQCRFTSTGAGNAIAVPDGKYIGQALTITHVVKGSSGTGVITAGAALHLADSVATITLTNARAWVSLFWTGTAWSVGPYGDVTFA